MNYELNVEYLIERLAPQLSEEQIDSVYRAYQFAEEAHSGQTRDEGTPLHHSSGARGGVTGG